MQFAITHSGDTVHVGHSKVDGIAVQIPDDMLGNVASGLLLKLAAHLLESGDTPLGKRSPGVHLFS